ncbi:MAG: fatty acid--CoA ligase family protein [Oscillospiraceae bacterium]|jgi:fatty-acyl-CoA synthase|nr:fatty acid--CoA ligase family protein [Oscillospiraceae bacterium]
MNDEIQSGVYNGSLTIDNLLSERAKTRPGGEAVLFRNRIVTWRELYRLAKMTEVPRGKLVYIGTPTTERPSIEAFRCILAYLACQVKGKIAIFGKQGTLTEEEEQKVIDNASDGTVYDAILFTSGSTGKPKAVLTKQSARLRSAALHAKALGAVENDRFLLAIPLHHCFSLTANLVCSILTGAALVIPDDRHSSSIIKAASEYKCTVLNAVPTVFSALLRSDSRHKYDLSALRTGFIGGSPYSPEFFIEANNILGLNLIPGLGQTEATASFTFLPYTATLEERAFTVGRFGDGIDGRIGADGEILIRGFCVAEIINQTSSVRDGWLHTGDTGQIRDDGLLVTTGRLKDIIIRGGENISPAEIENALTKAIPEIREVVVFGVSDEHFGEEIACVLSLEREFDIKKAIRELKTLPSFKLPKYVYTFNELPKTTGGKFDVAKIKTMVEANNP